MKAARLHAIGDFRLDEIPAPRPTGAELLVKIGGCGICGSDIPRIYRSGTSRQKYPLTIGHEFSGTVVEVGPDADASLIGKRGAFYPLIPCGHCGMCRVGQYAMCENYDYMGSRRDGGFADYALVPSAWNFVPSQNPETPLEALCVTEPACVAQHAVRRSRLTAGESLIVFGAGPIGILTARWAAVFGARNILLVDVDDEKVRFARERGFAAVNSRKEDPADTFLRLNEGKGADAAIEGTGFVSALENCIDAVKPMGRVVLLGNPSGDGTLGQKAHSAILRKELAIYGTWNSSYAPLPVDEWKYTVRMLDEGRLEVLDLITHRCALEGLASLCGKIRDRQASVCKAVCVPGGEP